MADRSSGVLLHISSLPGEYGVGTFGADARRFVKWIADAGFSYWQVLPFTHSSSGNSPYTCFSAFAGNPFFIDPEILFHKGLITMEELDSAMSSNIYSADFDFVNETRLDLLHKAFSRSDRKSVEDFCAENPWVEDYSKYMTLFYANECTAWDKWLITDLEAFEDDVLFWQYIQYEFYSQWRELKVYANGLGVKIIGDMPIYVDYNSSDLWSNKKYFLIDNEGNPSHVAGVPPDYFNTDGQLWGNPLYDWSELKSDGYSWWLNRIGHALDNYDMVRFDHFRGFSSYWAVPADAKSAKEGSWQKGPGMDFFRAVQAKFGKQGIIAEDLGEMDKDVYNLVTESGYPGMRVLEFGFDYGGENHLPHSYVQDCVAYTGTHDNNTFYGWIMDAPPGTREYAIKYLNIDKEKWAEGGCGCVSSKAAIRALMQSVANLVILPMQDLLGYGMDTRMNKPGVALGNWSYRVTWDQLNEIDSKWLLDMNNIYARNGK